MQTTPPPNLASTQQILLAMHQKKAYDASKKAKATQERKKQLEMASLVEEVQPPKKQRFTSAKKLTFADCDTLVDIDKVNYEINALLEAEKGSLDITSEPVLICYCDDSLKLCTSKNGREFYCCNNSRFNNEKKQYESDCDFFLFKDEIGKERCKCDIPMRTFKMKDGLHTADMCLYKNAPTIWKKAHHYDCGVLIKTKI